jgi:hypothetical protein
VLSRPASTKTMPHVVRDEMSPSWPPPTTQATVTRQNEDCLPANDCEKTMKAQIVFYVL